MKANALKGYGALIKDRRGNEALLKLKKTAFFCSRRYPASVVLKSYDWEKNMRREGNCVISGNHSQIEKDVFQYLLKRRQPVILALARGMIKRLSPVMEHALNQEQLLILAPYSPGVTCASQETANRRNELMAELADEILVAFAQPGGNIERLVDKWLVKGKMVRAFDVLENRALISSGALAIRKEV